MRVLVRNLIAAATPAIAAPCLPDTRVLRILALLVLTVVAVPVDARPRVIEESQRLDAPGSDYSFFAQSVAIDGDWALATALQSDDGSFNYPYRQLALLYRRTAGTWAFDRVLVDDPTDEASWNDPKVALKNDLAAISTSPLRVSVLASADRVDAGVRAVHACILGEAS